MKLFLTAALAAGMVTAATAAPFVDYTVSGSSGNWILDFRVQNTLNPDDMDIYFFGVELGARDIVGSPSSDWDPNVWPAWDNSGYGGSNIVYNNNWIDFTFDGLFPGQTVSGFQARVTTANAPTQVNWFCFGYGTAGGQYNGNDYFNNPGNPGFEGIAHVVPEPATLSLLGLGLLPLIRRKK